MAELKKIRLFAGVLLQFEMRNHTNEPLSIILFRSLPVSSGNILGNSITEYVIVSVFYIDIFTSLTNYNGQFYFPIKSLKKSIKFFD